MNTRNPYFDFLRGFAIIMVVGIHTVVNYSPGFETFEDICTIIARSLLNCAVPLFLAISGYFVAKKKVSSKKEHLIFLKNQIPKVYIPCLIFSVPYFLLAIYSGSNGVLKPLVTMFACGFSVYYFIALIIQYYILLPVFVKFNKLRGGGFNIYNFHHLHIGCHVSHESAGSEHTPSDLCRSLPIMDCILFHGRLLLQPRPRLRSHNADYCHYCWIGPSDSGIQSLV